MRDLPLDKLGPHLRARRYAESDGAFVTIRAQPGDDDSAVRVPRAAIEALCAAHQALREARVLLQRVATPSSIIPAMIPGIIHTTADNRKPKTENP